MLIPLIVSALLIQCPIEIDEAPMTPGGLSGTSVAIYGDVIAIGSPLGTGNEWASGVILVYRLDGNNWIKEAELIADDLDAGDMMGVSVDIYENRIIAGAWFEDQEGSNSGAAYIFEHQQGQWSQTAKLVASDVSAEDTFGRRVAIQNDICVVTSPLDDDNGSTSGSAYIFRYSKGTQTWDQDQKLNAKSGASDDQFGLGLAMDANTIVVGSPWANNGAGQVHIFQSKGNKFEETQIISDPSASSGDNFGFGVSVDNATIAIGSYHDSDLNFDAGSVFIYSKKSKGNWLYQQKIYPEDGVPGEQFGVDVSIDDNTLLIGHRFGLSSDVSTGIASTYKTIGNKWEYQSRLEPSMNFNGAEFGWSVDLHGSNAVIGAPWAEPDGYAEFYGDIVNGCQCDSDVNEDGIVGVADLLAVIAAWGDSCSDCPEDVNNDSSIDVSDILLIINSWGVCK